MAVRVLKQLHIASGQLSRVYDYRAFTRPNGGTIALRACVHHIPVIHQMPGRADLDALRQVLIAQGLMVQFGTDGEGNVALFTRANRLCYQAAGGNQLTCGIEHMHYATGEAWSLRQLRAAAWIAQYLEREFGIPLQMANVEPGYPVKIVRKGHTSHEQITRMAKAAGARIDGREDPGKGFDYEHMFAAANFFKRKGHFVGA
jgi:hypothetical protein